MKGDFTRYRFRPENHYSQVLMQQGRVQLDSDWNEQRAIQTHLNTTLGSDVIGSTGAPQAQAGFAIHIEQNTPRIRPGRYYVDGLLCENEADIALTQQPDLPDFELATEPGIYLAYLDVWQRHITAVEDADIREVALGGPDTSTRVKTTCQVKLLKVAELVDNVSCFSEFETFNNEITSRASQLRAQTREEESDNPCILPPGTGYRRLENQLYRVEVHTSGRAGEATFKWSRENGSIVTPWLEQNGNDLTVSNLGRNGTGSFAGGQWVELIDDTRELQGIPGTFVQLVKVEGQILSIDPETATGSINRADFANNPKVRHWDSPGLLDLQLPTDADDWLPLEDGIEIQFAGDDFRVGEYWLIPARTATGEIDWPIDLSDDPILQRSQGIEHHFCRLALLKLEGGNWIVEGDCRQLFPPLSQASLHVAAVQIDTGPLRNNSPVSVELLNLGLFIDCDAAIDAETVSQPTCFVTLDLPISNTSTNSPQWGGAPVGFQPLILSGNPTVQGPRITWIADAATQAWLTDQFPSIVNAVGGQLRARLTLKGRFIWSDHDPAVFLDGEVFGAPPGDTPNDLQLPSGRSGRGSDFEMWFFLTAAVAPITPVSVELNPASVVGGTPSQGTVTLSEPATPGDIEVTLTSANRSAAAPPRTVTVANGQSQATFQIDTQPVLQTTPVVMTASSSGVSQAASLSVATPRPAFLSVSPSSLTGGARATGTVSLNGPAPTGGARIDLLSSLPSAATVPASITVAAGQTSASFSISTQSTSQNRTVTITASRGGFSQTDTLTVSQPRPSSVSLSPSTVTGGNTSTGTVSLNGAAPSGGARVSLSSSRTAVARVAASVTVAAGQTSATFTVTTQTVSSGTSSVISATFGGTTQQRTLTVNPLPVSLQSLSISPTRVIAGSSTTGTVRLSRAATSSISVSLSSNNTDAATVPSSVTVRSGSSTATFTISTSRSATRDPLDVASITALRSGVTRRGTITVLQGFITGPLGPFNPR